MSSSISELELVEQQGVLDMTVLNIPYWLDILVLYRKGPQSKAAYRSDLIIFPVTYWFSCTRTRSASTQ